MTSNDANDKQRNLGKKRKKKGKETSVRKGQQ